MLGGLGPTSTSTPPPPPPPSLESLRDKHTSGSLVRCDSSLARRPSFILFSTLRLNDHVTVSFGAASARAPFL